MSKIIIEVIVN